MDSYIDIAILPDAEFPQNILLNSLYSKLHKVLFEMGSMRIGVSFPEYDYNLGGVLRLHGEKERLSDLQRTNWLGGMSGYCQVSLVFPVPSGVKYRTVSRVQMTMSQAKLRRLIKRDSMSAEDIKEYQKKMLVNGLDNPFVEMVSSSSGRRYRRYIKFGPLVDKAVIDKFDHFGLSKVATIPWF